MDLWLLAALAALIVASVPLFIWARKVDRQRRERAEFKSALWFALMSRYDP